MDCLKVIEFEFSSQRPFMKNDIKIYILWKSIKLLNQVFNSNLNRLVYFIIILGHDTWFIQYEDWFWGLIIHLTFVLFAFFVLLISLFLFLVFLIFLLFIFFFFFSLKNWVFTCFRDFTLKLDTIDDLVLNLNLLFSSFYHLFSFSFRPSFSFFVLLLTKIRPYFGRHARFQHFLIKAQNWIAN